MDDVALLHELEPEAARLLERHLGNAEEWFPHDVVPWERASSLVSDGFTYASDNIPVAVRSALFVNLLTEDNLPWYSRTISRVFSRDSAWGEWVHRWTAEEGRHAIAMRDYITVSGLLDPVELERARMTQVSTAVVPEPESAADGMCYVAMQELATRLSHRNTGKLLNDPVGYNVMMRLSTDENHHHLFYRDLVSKLLEMDPSTGVIALSRQVLNFAMPGVGIPHFEQHAKLIAKAEIYDYVIHYEKILVPLLTRHWVVDALSGLNAAAEQARDALINHMERLSKIVARQIDRRGAAAPVGQ